MVRVMASQKMLGSPFLNPCYPAHRCTYFCCVYSMLGWNGLPFLRQLEIWNYWNFWKWFPHPRILLVTHSTIPICTGTGRLTPAMLLWKRENFFPNQVRGAASQWVCLDLCCLWRWYKSEQPVTALHHQGKQIGIWHFAGPNTATTPAPKNTCHPLTLAPPPKPCASREWPVQPPFLRRHRKAVAPCECCRRTLWRFCDTPGQHKGLPPAWWGI